MKKKTLFISALSLCILIVLCVSFYGDYYRNNSSRIQEKEVGSRQRYVLSSNEIYHLYYLLMTQKLLDNSKLYIDEVNLIDPSTLFNKENQGLLFDMWLYVTLFNEYGLSISEQNKENIISLLTLLQNDDGLFRSFYSEGEYEDEFNYVFPTKLALEIYRLLNVDVPNKSKIRLWMDENIDSIMYIKKEDFISSGGFLYLFKYIKSTYNDNSENLLKQYGEMVSNSYENTSNSAEKFDTALNINAEFSYDLLNIDRNIVSEYLNDVQLESGAFSLYGNKKDADAMTTFISVRLLSHFKIDIPKESKLTEWLNNEINAVLISNKI